MQELMADQSENAPHTRAGSPGAQAMEEGASVTEQFRALLLALSIRFVHLPPDQVDGEIEDALRCVCEFLGVHRSSLWQGSRAVRDSWRLTHLYQHPDHTAVLVTPDGEIVPRGGWTLLRPAVPPRQTVMAAQEYFPWVSEKLRRHEIVVLNSLDELPPAAATDRKSFTQLESRSILVFPLAAGDWVFGCLSFAMIGEGRTWTKEIVDNLHLIDQVFAHALTRKIDDLALRESEKGLSLAAAAAGIALGSIDYGSQRVWASEPGRERLELPPGELTLTRFLALVHPEDRARVDEAYRASVNRAEVEVEYRLVRPDGGVRWVISRGRAQIDPAGKLDRLMGVTLDITERKEMESRV